MIALAKEKKRKYALDFLGIAKYFERIENHAANITKWAVFGGKRL